MIATNDNDDQTKEESKKERITIVLNEKDLIESFVKGSGNGGQKINKTSNCVDLRHVPTGVRVVCQQTRSLQQNRSIARKIMIEKLDDYYNGDQSKSAIKREIARKREAKRRKRAREKYGATNSKEETSIE
ncbi:RF-1 domain-containing protein [Gigaspora rosea]|uniref:RF-1 domain-containing protein n=1 Tax=Gigaspora rosea TaxID=44941 RepID=A0A397V342_9GLOM|nr:RF-1 domain-containing protein [Gigaspora rosea]CAG8478557.1 11578_t:CDS:2 [Gigaspora rosea]